MTDARGKIVAAIGELIIALDTVDTDRLCMGPTHNLWTEYCRCRDEITKLGIDCLPDSRPFMRPFHELKDSLPPAQEAPHGV